MYFVIGLIVGHIIVRLYLAIKDRKDNKPISMRPWKAYELYSWAYWENDLLKATRIKRVYNKMFERLNENEKFRTLRMIESLKRTDMIMQSQALCYRIGR